MEINRTLLTLFCIVLFSCCSAGGAVAARVINSATLDGSDQVTVEPEATVSATVNVTTSGSGSSNNWGSTGWSIGATSSGCENHSPPHNSSGTYAETFDISAPDIAGVYNVTFTAYSAANCNQNPSTTLVKTAGVTVGIPTPPAVLAEYHFGEPSWLGTAAEVIDSSINSYDATAVNGATTANITPAIPANPGTCNYGVFDGVNDYVALPDNFPDIASNFTITAWIRTTNNTRSGQRILIDDQNNTGGYGFSLGDGGTGRVRFYSRNSNPVYIDTPNVIANNTWYFVAAVADVSNNRKTIYVYDQTGNQLAATTGAYTGTWGTDSGFASIGGENNASTETGPSFHFSGNIDEVSVYAGAMSATQIEAAQQQTQYCQHFCFEDDFNRASLGDSWTIIKQDNYTPQISDNRLVLTSASGNIASGVTLKGSYPAQDNYVEIEFDHYAYGGSGADGIVLVLSDAAVVPVAGAYGGSLGYANRTGQAGFAGGWLGFGIDEFGNFSNPTEGRNGGTGRVLDAVAVRGHGDSSSDYVFLTGTSSLSPGVDLANSATPALGHHYRFSIDTRNDMTLLKVERDSGSGYATVIDWTDVTQTATAPQNFRVSLTASTGGSTNIHAIDNFTMNALSCGTIGEGEIDHFLFVHDGDGLTCAAEQVTLVACANSDCSQVYSGDIQVQLPDIGWLDGTIQTLSFPASGQVALALKHTTAETVSLGVIVSTPDASTPTQCSGGSTTACGLTFHDSGFLLDSEDGRSCSTLLGTIQAVQKDNATNLCVGDDSFANVTRNVGMWFDYANPTSGTVLPVVNTKSLVAASPGTAVSLVFDAQASAPLTLSYADAGALNLHARYVGAAGGVDGGLVMDGSTSVPIVVAPHHFAVTSPLTNTTTSGTPKAAAGDPFTASVQAVCSDGTVTPNFSWATQLSLLASQPTTPGVLSNGVLAAAEFTGGTATPADLSYSEVGNITLQALAEDYQGSVMDISGSSAVIGRFHPHHFSVETNTPTLAPGCTTFSYLGQPLNYSVAPQITISARNAAGGVTTNYLGSWWHLGDINESYSDATAGALAVSIDSALAAHTPATSAGDVATPGQVAVAFSGPLAYTAPAAGNVPPFTADMLLSFFVDDGDASYVGGNPFTLNIGFDPAAAAEIRHGRLRLVNAHGSELLPLAMPIVAEYFSGSSFVTNGADSCTALSLPQFVFIPAPATIAAADSLAAVSGGTGSVNWSNPGYPVGTVDVLVDLATGPYWLQYDWDGDGTVTNPPAARATFGIYKGSEHIIYLRETTWR